MYNIKMTIIEGTLYHADWCLHCIKFKPEWDKFCDKVSMMGGNFKDTKIITNDIQDSAIKEKVLIGGKEIKGYPTLKIVVKNKKGKSTEYEYSGERSFDALYKHFTTEAVNKLK